MEDHVTNSGELLTRSYGDTYAASIADTIEVLRTDAAEGRRRSRSCRTFSQAEEVYGPRRPRGRPKKVQPVTEDAEKAAYREPADQQQAGFDKIETAAEAPEQPFGSEPEGLDTAAP